MFQKGDIVHYGMYGICEIEDISTVDFPDADEDSLYYILRSRKGNETMYVAVDWENTKMRKVISKEEAEVLISKIADLKPLELKNEKRPEAEYKKVLHQYDCLELFRLIKCIYFRNKQRIDEGKTVIGADGKYLQMAEDLLYQEIGEALGIPKEQVLGYLIEKIR